MPTDPIQAQKPETLERTEGPDKEGESKPGDQEMTYEEITKEMENNRQLIEILRNGAQTTREELQRLRAGLASEGVPIQENMPAAESTAKQIVALEARNHELEKAKQILEKKAQQEGLTTPSEQGTVPHPETAAKEDTVRFEVTPAKTEILPQINLNETKGEQEEPTTEIEKALAIIYDALDLNHLIIASPQERRSEISRIVQEKGITVGGQRDAELEEAIIGELSNPDLEQNGLLKTRESFIQDGLKRLQGILASREQQKSPLEHQESSGSTEID